MKQIQIKKLILATAITVAGVGFNVNADDRFDKTSDSVEALTAPPDRNITNPNVDGYTPREAAPIVESADVDHEGVVHFDPNSVTLSQQGEGQLKQLVEQLDKDKPIALTVAMRERHDPKTESPQSQSVRGSKDSSAGYPGEGEGLAGRNIEPSQENRAELIARYRMESIRLYLQEKGIEVVEWNMEGQPSSFSGTQPSAEAAMAGGTEAGLGDNIQQVRVVVIGEIQPEGLSSL